MATMPAQRPGRSKQDYRTPLEFLTAVRRFLGIRDFCRDLAASADNAVCPLYYDQAKNSLTQSWDVGEDASTWAWCNPEYVDIRPWVQKAAEGVQNVAMLLPASVGANWWRDWVDGKARVLLLNGRLTFVGCTTPYPKDCALLLYGLEPGYEVWDWRALLPRHPVRHKRPKVVLQHPA